jgi:hypothetical protein
LDKRLAELDEDVDKLLSTTSERRLRLIKELGAKYGPTVVGAPFKTLASAVCQSLDSLAARRPNQTKRGRRAGAAKPRSSWSNHHIVRSDGLSQPGKSTRTSGRKRPRNGMTWHVIESAHR